MESQRKMEGTWKLKEWVWIKTFIFMYVCLFLFMKRWNWSCMESKCWVLLDVMKAEILVIFLCHTYVSLFGWTSWWQWETFLKRCVYASNWLVDFWILLLVMSCLLWLVVNSINTHEKNWDTITDNDNFYLIQYVVAKSSGCSKEIFKIFGYLMAK